jgi:hypothetical protein
MSFALVDALVTLAEESGSDAVIRDLRAQALARVQAGQGEVKSLVSTTVAGQTFTWRTEMTAVDMLAATAAALRAYAGSGNPGVSYPTWTSIPL